MSPALSALRRLSARLPSAIIHIEYYDPVLVIGGAGWNFSLITPWRIVADGELILGSDDATHDEVMALFHGQTVMSCDLQSKHAPLDLALLFENRRILEVFAVAGLEPWTLSVADEGMFIGP